MEHDVIVALSPAEMPAVQTALVEWCAEKVKALQKEMAELEEHQLIASGNGWKLSSLRSALNRTARRITYYDKMKQAVEEGFLMVPNFPVTLLAVRTSRAKPKADSRDWARNFDVPAELLPAGSGRYVDDQVGYQDDSYDTSDGKGGTKRVRHFTSLDAFDEPDFPVTAVKPAVMSATARAMALKVFDEIGMVENRSGRDPIMVGRLIDPRGGGRCATFFIAWWLDPSTL